MPSIISPFVLIAAYGVIIALALYMTYTSKDYSRFEGGRLRIFLAVVGGLGTLVTFMFYYNLVMIQNTQAERDLEAGRVQLDNRLSVVLVDELQKATPIVPSFVRSLTRLTCELDLPIVESIDERTLEAMSMKLALASKIFYTWDAFMSDRRSSGHEFKNSYVYLAAFLQQAGSSQLKQYWDELAPTMRESTRIFGEILFERASKIERIPDGQCAGAPQSSSFAAAAKELAQDRDYLKLIRPPTSFFSRTPDIIG